jgi:acetyltransferase-like isoleucine patch superfamily enzyme
MIKHILFKLYKRLLKTIENYEISLIYENKSISIAQNVIIHGKPIIEVTDSATIILEENVLIDSNNNGYHLSMYNPVKLKAENANSIIRIGKNTRIHGSCIHASKSVFIGERCLIAANCQIIDNNGHELCFENVENRINTYGTSKPIYIENDVWLGTGCIVLPGVTIGKGSVIGANSVIAKDIPPFSLVIGNNVKTFK